MSDKTRTHFNLKHNVECVECDSCGFIFARAHADHVSEPESRYTCPNCEHWGYIEHA